jgi:PAS domain S-box-containing protein
VPPLSTQELGELVELAHDAILVRDQESRIVFWNRGAADLYGWSPDEAIGQVSHDLLRTTFPQPLRELERTLFARGAWAGELVHRSKSDAELMVASRWALRSGRGRPMIVMEINRDMTAARRVEQALRTSEQALADLFDNASDLIQVATVDGRLRYANRAWLDALGYRGEEVEGLAVSEIVHPQQRAHYQAFTQRALAGRPGRLETLLRARDGREIPVEGEIHVDLDGGAPVSVSGFFRDITVRKQAEAEREQLFRAEREARQALAQQNAKLRELDMLKDEFISLISHEFRTPLTSIAGFVDLLLDDGQLPRDQHRYLGVIDRNAKLLVRLVDDLLLVAQIDADRFALQVREADLRHIVDEAVAGAQPAAEAAGVALEADIPSNPLLAAADEERVAQLLDNLISNAIKFTPSGGRVRVSCRSRRSA